MPPTTSFTPQSVINTARLRHPGLSILVLDDPELVDDYNQSTRMLMTQVIKTKREALMQETADLVKKERIMIDTEPQMLKELI